MLINVNINDDDNDKKEVMAR